VFGTNRGNRRGDGDGDGVRLALGVESVALGEPNSFLLDNIVGGKFGLVSHSIPFR
jgi:hypothetical protein